MSEPEYTHEGWFLICPILARFDDYGEVELKPKYNLTFLFTIADEIQTFANFICELINPDFEPGFLLLLRKRKQC